LSFLIPFHHSPIFFNHHIFALNYILPFIQQANDKHFHDLRPAEQKFSNFLSKKKILTISNSLTHAHQLHISKILSLHFYNSTAPTTCFFTTILDSLKIENVSTMQARNFFPIKYIPEEALKIIIQSAVDFLKATDKKCIRILSRYSIKSSGSFLTFLLANYANDFQNSN
jgi:hypothetical protein